MGSCQGTCNQTTEGLPNYRNLLNYFFKDSRHEIRKAGGHGIFNNGVDFLT